MSASLFKPAIDHIGQWRLCRKPAEGKIIHTETLDGMELAQYKNSDGRVEWRVLEPETPVPVDRIELFRAEGPVHLCSKKPTVCRGGVRSGTGQSGSIFEKDWHCSAFIEAGSELLQWGFTAPKGGGYDKCDFTIFWTNGDSYEGRFDLQHGGTDAGENFRESFLSRLRFYAGLCSYIPQFKRKNAVEEYTDDEAREHYLKYLDTYLDGTKDARRMLGQLEL